MLWWNLILLSQWWHFNYFWIILLAFPFEYLQNFYASIICIYGLQYLVLIFFFIQLLADSRVLVNFAFWWTSQSTPLLTVPSSVHSTCVYGSDQVYMLFTYAILFSSASEIGMKICLVGLLHSHITFYCLVFLSHCLMFCKLVGSMGTRAVL